tara:strand:+ start:6540 stop:7472 length:933 start_codon:yes stop_codon:yes gene_type:complete
MGGSGGGFYRSSDRDSMEYAQKLREIEQKSIGKEFDIEVSKLLSDLLARYNDRDVESTSKHLEIIKNKLDKELESSVDLVFNGSVARHTYVDGFSDVDALLVFDKSSLEGKSPTEVRTLIGKLIQERLPKTEVKIGSQAITINFHDIKIQVLPAAKYYDGYRISDESGQTWANVKPKEFASKLTAVNRQLGGKLVPTIKLVKSIIAQSPSSKMSGYQAESLAIDVFKNYKGDSNTKSMLKHFFKDASGKILNPIKDSAGTKISVDADLGSANSLKRRILSNSFDRIARRMNNADGAQNIENWNKILNPED